MATKVLVGGASLVVIVVGVFWLWQQYSDNEAAKAAEAFADSRTVCLSILDRHMSPGTSSADTEALSRDCIERGLINNADIDRRR